MNSEIYIIDNQSQRDFLARPTEYFDFEKHSKKEVDDILRRMRSAMHEANGIGLSANQIGLPYRLFIAEIPGQDGMKFYAIFNPEIEKMDKEKTIMEEGCLSVPGIYGDVERPERLVLKGQDKRGKKLKIKAWGLLARIFQHEMDHLNGKLFLEKAENTHRINREEDEISQ